MFLLLAWRKIGNSASHNYTIIIIQNFQALNTTQLSYQGSCWLLEISINQRETLIRYFASTQWHEKCVQHNLELTHIQSQNDGVTQL